MREFQHTLTRRESRDSESRSACSEHQAVSPPSSRRDAPLREALGLALRSQEVHLNSSWEKTLGIDAIHNP
ncbi:MAG: hypothetical protein R3242_00920 [Akkermansiaceae bacterium]|nr:hypothetical protein [Akkermansiaceae bacterium]